MWNQFVLHCIVDKWQGWTIRDLSTFGFSFQLMLGLTRIYVFSLVQLSKFVVNFYRYFSKKVSQLRAKVWNVCVTNLVTDACKWSLDKSWSSFLTLHECANDAWQWGRRKRQTKNVKDFLNCIENSEKLCLKSFVDVYKRKTPNICNAFFSSCFKNLTHPHCSKNIKKSYFARFAFLKSLEYFFLPLTF